MNLDFLTPEEAFAAQLALKDMSVEEKMLFLADLEERAPCALAWCAK